jgi:hypothetical protein
VQRGVVVLLAAVTVAGWSPAAAQTPPVGVPPATGLEASRPHLGWVSIRVTGPPGSTATIVEAGNAGPEPIATVTIAPTGAADLDHAVRWRCDRATRRFAVTVTDPAGTTQTARANVASPTCRARRGVAPVS